MTTPIDIYVLPLSYYVEFKKAVSPFSLRLVQGFVPIKSHLKFYYRNKLILLTQTQYNFLNRYTAMLYFFNLCGTKLLG